MSVEVRKAHKEEFAKIQRLLLSQLPPPRNTSDPWVELVDQPWDKEKDYIGYVLAENSNIYGFLGTIFCKRVLNKKLFNFCNISSWAVDKSYRKYSLGLLMPLLKMKDYVLTSLTAAKHVVSIFKRFGFKDLETRQRIILPIPLWNLKPKEDMVDIFAVNEIADKLNAEQKKIYEDHSKYKCTHFYLGVNAGSLYVIATRVQRKGLPFAYIQYISDIAIFEKYLNVLRNKMIKEMGVFGIIVDSRFLKNDKLFFSLDHLLDQPKVFRSDDLSPDEIDNLYSEQILLNI